LIHDAAVDRVDGTRIDAAAALIAVVVAFCDGISPEVGIQQQCAKTDAVSVAFVGEQGIGCDDTEPGQSSGVFE